MSDLDTPDFGAVAREWWRNCIWDNPADRAGRSRRRAARARLRRAKTPLDVIQEPEALRLVARFPPRRRDRAAVLAGILAFVEEDDNRPVARVIGRESFGSDEPPPMSEARFRRLLQTEANELLDPMRRLLLLADGKANVGDLSEAVLYWNDKTRKRWIYLYHDVSAYPSN